MNQALADLAAEYWELKMQTSPTSAHLIGDYRYADQMEDLTRATEDEAIARLDDIVARTGQIDDALLGADERITKGVLLFEAGTDADELRSRMAELDVNHTQGIHVTLLQLIGQLPVPTAEVADAVVVKWSKIGTLFDQAIGRLRQGIARDRTPPRVAVEKSIEQIDGYLASDLAVDPFTMLAPPTGFTDEQIADWREALAAQVTGAIRPGFERYRRALAEEVLEKSRPPERTGVRWLPDGEEVYARAIHRHTSLVMTPFEIHQIGLDGIAGLESEYAELGTRVLGTSAVDQIFDRLRNDESLRFDSAATITAAAKSAMERAQAAIPEWFGRLPSADCVMAEIGVGAEEAPLAYYLSPAADGSRPGTFFVNTTEPTTRTKYESEALAFHESIPGHHLQLALALELEAIPEFRRNALVTAYVEGWGLYVERLADEMGLYSGDLARLGILSFDSWRAGRLVVDTGMHALGWSRQEAIDYLVANSPQAPNNIANEVDRYIGWPGQALAYKMGQREFLRLRDVARDRLGSAFDIKGFHDAVLGSGPVPLPILDDLVEGWIAASQR